MSDNAHHFKITRPRSHIESGSKAHGETFDVHFQSEEESNEKAHFDFDPKTHRWRCDEITDSGVEGDRRRSIAHHSEGTYSFTGDGSHIRLAVQSHQKEPHALTKAQRGTVVDVDLAEVRQHGGIPPVFGHVWAHGDIMALKPPSDI